MIWSPRRCWVPILGLTDPGPSSMCAGESEGGQHQGSTEPTSNKEGTCQDPRPARSTPRQARGDRSKSEDPRSHTCTWRQVSSAPWSLVFGFQKSILHPTQGLSLLMPWIPSESCHRLSRVHSHQGDEGEDMEAHPAGRRGFTAKVIHQMRAGPGRRHQGCSHLSNPVHGH